MISFFCTRCGTALEVEPEHAGGEVRCGHCSTVVRAPETAPPQEEIPFAQVAMADVEQTASSSMLSYRTPWGPRDEILNIDALAERLNRVEAPDESVEEDGMSRCKYCGSTIARYMRKCPFCRHALWGM